MVDFSTDAVNAGNGLHAKNIYHARLNIATAKNGVITYSWVDV